MTGHSFGGWTTLAVTGRDSRIRAALPLAPAGGETPLLAGRNELRESLDLDWKREVPTLYLGLAHMDAHLKAIPSAAELLAGDLQALLAERGVGVKQV